MITFTKKRLDLLADNIDEHIAKHGCNTRELYKIYKKSPYAAIARIILNKYDKFIYISSQGTKFIIKDVKTLKKELKK